MEKKNSKTYPKLPELFDDLEEQVYFGVTNIYDAVIEFVKELDKEIDINNFKIKLNQILNELVDYPEAMRIFKEKGIIEEYQEGARLYVIENLKKSSILNKFLEMMPAEFRELLIEYALKGFFDQLYKLYKFAEEDGDPWW